MVDAYKYIRFRWWTGIDLKKVSTELAKNFTVKPVVWPSSEYELVLNKDERIQLKVKADTLSAELAPSRAVLFQIKPSPFTPSDIELRKKILELYPRNRPSPLPLEYSFEPKHT